MVANDLATAYETWRGPVTVRGRAFIEDEEEEEPSPDKKASKRKAKKGAGGKPLIVVTELPFQTNKAKLVIHIAGLVDDGTLQGYPPSPPSLPKHLLTHSPDP